MKPKELIKQRIDKLEKERGNKSADDYEVQYLKIALEKDENELQLLLDKYKLFIVKYEFELNEDIQIVKSLSWVLDDDNDDNEL